MPSKFISGLNLRQYLATIQVVWASFSSRFMSIEGGHQVVYTKLDLKHPSAFLHGPSITTALQMKSVWLSLNVLAVNWHPDVGNPCKCPGWPEVGGACSYTAVVALVYSGMLRSVMQESKRMFEIQFGVNHLTPTFCTYKSTVRSPERSPSRSKCKCCLKFSPEINFDGISPMLTSTCSVYLSAS